MSTKEDLLLAEIADLREQLYRAENPAFNGRLDSWQAACGKARGESESLRNELRELKAESESLRKGWYLNECGDNKFWPEEMEELKAESEELRKAITDIYDALYREYWSEYAGLDETRAILDAALGRGEKS